jgi:hypothetical protein
VDQRSGLDLRVGATATSGDGVAFPGPVCGYDGRMSESANESTESEPGVITDEQLPEDLQPEKNPLARKPEDADDESGAPGPADGSTES